MNQLRVHVKHQSYHLMVFSFLYTPGDSEREADQLPARRIAQRRQKVYQIERVQGGLLRHCAFFAQCPFNLSNELSNKC